MLHSTLTEACSTPIVKKIATTGVDRISVGTITHSAVAIDLKIEI